MGGAQSKRAAKGLRFSLTLPHLKLELEGSEKNLPEVRRIIESINDEPTTEEPFFELKHRLSEEFFEYPPLTKRLKNALLLEEEVRILKRIIPVAQEYDLETGQQRRQINLLSVKSSVEQLFAELQGTVRESLLHIRGDLNREQQTAIMDAVKQHFGMGVETRFFLTKKNLEGNVLVEAICFGEGFGEAW